MFVFACFTAHVSLHPLHACTMTCGVCVCVHQVTVDTEVCMLTTDMLHVLFKCFMELTAGAKKEKVSLVVSIILY